MTIRELLARNHADALARRAEALQAMEALTATLETEKRSAFTPEEDTQFDEARQAVTTIDGEIETIEARMTELEQIEERSAKAAKAPTFNTNVNTADPFDIDLRSMPRTAATQADVVERAKRVVAEADITDAHRHTIDQRLRSADRNGALSRHIVATGRPEYRSGFAKLVTQAQPLLTQDEMRAVEEVRAMSIGTDSAGGYLMPFTLDPTIILTNNGAVNPIRSLATVKTTMTDNWQGVSSAGVTASYTAEAAEVADGSPTLAPTTVAVHQAHAFVPFSVQAEDDLANLSTDIAEMFADAKDRLEANKFTLGSGSSEPFGVITAVAAHNSGSSLVAAATGDAYAVADVYAVQNALAARHQPNASWMAALPVINLTRQFGSTLGHAFLASLGDGKPEGILGHALYENSEMDSTVTASATNYLLLYGDFKAYRIHDRIGLSIELVPHLFGSNGRPTGQRGWYARWRNGANVVDGNAFRLLNA